MSLVDYCRPKSRERLLRGEDVHWIKVKRGNYIRQCVLSFPPWVCRKSLQALTEQARAITLETGIPHVLDHIVPLNHPLVCGLTVPWNLQIITKKCNDSKGNRWYPDQLELW